MTRRTFFREAIRLLIGGVIGAVSGLLIVRSRRLDRAGQVCTGGGCPGCSSYRRCGLPRALSAKKVRGD